jgi:hypothetical protein
LLAAAEKSITHYLGRVRKAAKGEECHAYLFYYLKRKSRVRKEKNARIYTSFHACKCSDKEAISKADDAIQNSCSFLSPQRNRPNLLWRMATENIRAASMAASFTTHRKKN